MILKIFTFANKHKSLTQRISMWSEQEYFSACFFSHSVFKCLQMTISFVSKMNLWFMLKQPFMAIISPMHMVYISENKGVPVIYNTEPIKKKKKKIYAVKVLIRRSIFFFLIILCSTRQHPKQQPVSHFHYSSRALPEQPFQTHWNAKCLFGLELLNKH